MKLSLHHVSRLAFLGAMLITTQAALRAEAAVESTTTKTVTSAGTITEFSPDTIVVNTETSSAPVRYVYSKTTNYVDETGAPVAVSTIKSGVPVTIYYTQDGDRMVASKVIVRKTVTTTPAAPVTETTKTTTTTKK